MSKVMDIKQAEIRRKLVQSAIASTQEYEEIISSLISQRDRLQADLKILREKVVALQQKQAQKLAKTLRKRPSPLKIDLRQELTKKYQQLRQWQRRSLKAAKHPTVQLQFRAYFDKLFSIQQEIQLTLRQLNDELATNKRLRKAERGISREEAANNHAQDNMQRQNQLLKKRIYSLRKIVDRQLNKQVELQNYLIETQERQRERERQSRERYSRERQRRREAMSRQRRQREERQKKEQQQRRQRQRQQRQKQNTPSETSFHSFQSSDSELVDFQIHPHRIANKEEVYQIEGRLNRIEKRFRTAASEIEGRFKRNYPKEALKQKREGSKLTFCKQFEILVDRVKTNLNCFSELNKQKIKLLLRALQKQDRDRDKDRERKNSQISRSERSSASSLLHALKPIDGYRRTVKVHTEGEAPSPYKTASRVRSNASSTHFQEKVMYPRMKTVPMDSDTQTENIEQFYDHLTLRRQFVGNLELNSSFDRTILRDRPSSIRTLQMYYTDRGIATVKAIYTLHQSNHEIQGPLCLPEHFIRNYCKVHVIDTTHDDFIRYFKLRHSPRDGRITSIKTVTNRGVKNGWGDSKIREDWGPDEQDKELILDINEDEYPSAVFLSHMQRGPYWYLTAFGVEVDQL